MSKTGRVRFRALSTASGVPARFVPDGPAFPVAAAALDFDCIAAWATVLSKNVFIALQTNFACAPRNVFPYIAPVFGMVITPEAMAPRQAGAAAIIGTIDNPMFDGPTAENALHDDPPP
jgi:hypothetical protein